MRKIKYYGIIAFILTLSLLISSFLSKEMFVSNSPTVRPHLGSYIAMKMKYMMAPASIFIARLQGKDGIPKVKSISDRYAELSSVPFSNITKGVSAKEQNGVSVVRYDLNSIKWVEYTFTKRDGSKIVIKIPEGQKPPPPGSL